MYILCIESKKYSLQLDHSGFRPYIVLKYKLD